jgi:hypothetical protein
MTLNWVRLDPSGRGFDAPLEAINPYEDWEFATRPDIDPTEPDPSARWQPVYVALENRPPLWLYAQQMIDAFLAGRLTFDEDVAAFLNEIIAAKKTSIHPEPRFFIFRPENLSYSTDADGTPLPYSVIEVGPAIPMRYVTPRGAYGDAETTTLPAAGRSGETVVTAVIDDFIGLANERFRDRTGKTRFRQFWAQGMPAFSKKYGKITVPAIGREWDKAKLDAALAAADYEPDFYSKLFPGGLPIFVPSERGTYPANLYDPSFMRPVSFSATHGSHVADLAAGYPQAAAPDDRPIVAVQLPQLATLETWGARLDLFVLLAVQRVLYWVDRWTDASGKPVRAPVVINISYGVHAGPKDGSGFLEREIARLVKQRNDRGDPTAVVLPAGNSYRSRTHAEMTLDQGEVQGLSWRVQPEDLSVSFFELWLDDLASANLTIAPPVGPAQEFALSNATQVWDWQRTAYSSTPATIGRLYVQPKSQQRTRIIFALCPTLNHGDPPHTAPPGAYRLTLRNDAPARLTANWDVQRDDTPSSFPAYGRQAYYDHEDISELDPETHRYDRPLPACPVKRENTLSAHATAVEENVIVVGGAFDRDALAAAALYASSGPASGTRRSPDLSAVSEETRSHPGILAAGTFSGSAALFNGTSVAAPQVTRAIVDAWSNGPLIGTVDNVNACVGKTVPGGSEPRLGQKILTFRPQPDRPERRLPD